ncbi:ion transporter, partial [Tenacibaculum maritimum]
MNQQQAKNTTWKQKLHEIIYEADTPAGKLFDVVLLLAILASILLVMLESVEAINAEYSKLLNTTEWFI